LECIVVDETGKIEYWVSEGLFWKFDETYEFEVVEVTRKSEISNKIYSFVKRLIGKVKNLINYFGIINLFLKRLIFKFENKKEINR
jgi:hypothetical protein